MKSLDAVFANGLALIIDKILAVSAKEAVGLILFKNDAVAFNINFNGVLFGKAEGSSHLDRKNDSSQLVKLANNTSGFHFSTPPIFSIYWVDFCYSVTLVFQNSIANNNSNTNKSQSLN